MADYSDAESNGSLGEAAAAEAEARLDLVAIAAATGAEVAASGAGSIASGNRIPRLGELLSESGAVPPVRGVRGADSDSDSHNSQSGERAGGGMALDSKDGLSSGVVPPGDAVETEAVDVGGATTQVPEPSAAPPSETAPGGTWTEGDVTLAAGDGSAVAGDVDDLAAGDDSRGAASPASHPGLNRPGLSDAEAAGTPPPPVAQHVDPLADLPEGPALPSADADVALSPAAEASAPRGQPAAAEVHASGAMAPPSDGDSGSSEDDEGAPAQFVAPSVATAPARATGAMAPLSDHSSVSDDDDVISRGGDADKTAPVAPVPKAAMSPQLDLPTGDSQSAFAQGAASHGPPLDDASSNDGVVVDCQVAPPAPAPVDTSELRPVVAEGGCGQSAPGGVECAGREEAVSAAGGGALDEIDLFDALAGNGHADGANDFEMDFGVPTAAPIPVPVSAPAAEVPAVATSLAVATPPPPGPSVGNRDELAPIPSQNDRTIGASTATAAAKATEIPERAPLPPGGNSHRGSTDSGAVTNVGTGLTGARGVRRLVGSGGALPAAVAKYAAAAPQEEPEEVPVMPVSGPLGGAAAAVPLQRVNPVARAAPMPVVPAPSTPAVDDDEWGEANRAHAIVESRSERAPPLLNITFDEAYSQLFAADDWRSHINSQLKRETPSSGGFLACLCLGPRSLSEGSALYAERDFILALQFVPLDHGNQLHRRILLTIYRLAMRPKRHEPDPPTRGPAWDALGFQGDDPATDLRSTGLFGLLQLLYVVEAFPRFTGAMVDMSRGAQHNCPWAIAALNFAGVTMAAMKAKDLNSEAEKVHKAGKKRPPAGMPSVALAGVMNEFFVGCMHAFYHAWRSKPQRNVLDFDAVKKSVTVEVRGAIGGTLKRCEKARDEFSAAARANAQRDKLVSAGVMDSGPTFTSL